jgi:3-oxoacyl-[acyl-carrier-protein] synthase-1
MRKEGISLTHLGMVNALGQDVETLWPRILAGDRSGLTLQRGYLRGKTVRVGQVPGSLPAIPASLKRYRCRNNALAYAALAQIAEPIRAAIEKYGGRRVGVVVGSSTSGMAATERGYRFWKRSGRWPSSYDYVQHEMGGLAEFLAQAVGAEGPAYTLSTACSSSAKALGSARALLRLGWCDAVIAGGADSLCRVTVEGFHALEALSEKPCNSMSRHRDGFNIGEGAALFLMERSGECVQLLGVGESSDAYHISAPRPGGSGAYSAMNSALQDAGLAADSVSYINLHGTGTVLNDQMESRAVARLFPGTPASSTKAMVGHTLGAAGAMEVGFCWLALTRTRRGRIALPPHLWDGQRDPHLPPLTLVSKGQTLKRRGGEIFLSNSFGFGGSNCAVLIQGEP